MIKIIFDSYVGLCLSPIKYGATHDNCLNMKKKNYTCLFIQELFFYQFLNNFSALLLSETSIFDIFDMFNFLRGYMGFQGLKKHIFSNVF